MQEIGYGVVWPLGKRASEKVTLVPRITDLKNKTICELSDYGFKAEEIFPLLRASLAEQYVLAAGWPGLWRVDVVAIDLAPDGSASRLDHYQNAVMP